MLGWIAKTWRLDGGMSEEDETETSKTKVDTFNLVLGVPQTDCKLSADTATEEGSVSLFDFLFGTPSNESNSNEEFQTKYTEAISRTQTTTRSSSRTLDDIVVEGSGRFVNHANHCIEEVRGTKWESLVSELRKITQCSSYADSGVSNGVYAAASDSMGLGAWGDDRILGASVLIHEAVHTKRLFNGDFDITNYAGEELIALAEQAEFLRFHGHYSYAAYLETRDGRHNEPYMSPEILALQR